MRLLILNMGSGREVHESFPNFQISSTTKPGPAQITLIAAVRFKVYATLTVIVNVPMDMGGVGVIRAEKVYMRLVATPHAMNSTTAVVMEDVQERMGRASAFLAGWDRAAI